MYDALLITRRGTSTDLWITRTIPVLQQPPSPLEFYRDWVSQSRPCIIENVINDWPALRRWDYDYLTLAAAAIVPRGATTGGTEGICSPTLKSRGISYV